MSELDHDWIQRDLDGGALWDEGTDSLDLIAELRGRHVLEDLLETDRFFDEETYERH